MQVIRPVGRDAAAKKYDILSALMAHGLAGDKHRQRSVLRLMALITTRYNWQRDELTIGQVEIARLWSVDPRTVKREMARLRTLGWLVLKRAGARGRVSVYGLGLERLYLDTRPEWAHVGPDFVARMGGETEQGDPAAGKVVPLRPAAISPARTALWGAIRVKLEAEDPAIYSAWLAGLSDAGIEDGTLVLIAPSRFHAAYVSAHLLERLRMAARREDGAVTRVRVIGQGG